MGETAVAPWRSPVATSKGMFAQGWCVHLCVIWILQTIDFRLFVVCLLLTKLPRTQSRRCIHVYRIRTEVRVYSVVQNLQSLIPITKTSIRQLFYHLLKNASSRLLQRLCVGSANLNVAPKCNFWSAHHITNCAPRWKMCFPVLHISIESFVESNSVQVLCSVKVKNPNPCILCGGEKDIIPCCTRTNNPLIVLKNHT